MVKYPWMFGDFHPSFHVMIGFVIQLCFTHFSDPGWLSGSRCFFNFAKALPAAISNLSSKNRSFGSSKSCSNSDQDKSPSPWNPFWLDFLRFFGVKFEVQFLYTSKWSGSKKDGWKNFCRFGDRWNIRLYMFSLALKIMDDFLKYNLMKYITHLRLEYLLTFGCKYSQSLSKGAFGLYYPSHSKLMSFNRIFSMSNWFLEKAPRSNWDVENSAPNRTPRAKSGNEPLPFRYTAWQFFPTTHNILKKKLPCFNPEDFEETFEKKTSKKNTYQVIQAVTFSSPNVGGHDSPTKVTFSQNCQVLWGIFIFKKKRLRDSEPEVSNFRRSLPRSWSIFLLPALLTAGQQNSCVSTWERNRS